MKQLTTRILSLILIISTVFTLSVPAFATSGENAVSNISTEDSGYILIDTIETPYGTAYYVQPNDGIQPATFWDVVDIVMAGKAWADLFANPSWGNFGWAILDTAAILPLLPSSAYFRQGGKVLLKVDEVAKFAKTTKGKAAVETAMKAFKYSDGITQKAIKAISKKFKGAEAERVLKLFQDAANKGLVGNKGMSGIKAITPSKVIGKQYTHEIKIISSQYGDYRIFGYQTKTGTWVFDLFREGLH